MKVLLDHCVPASLASHLSVHDIVLAHTMGWQTLKNGRLLAAAAEAGFAVMITTDKNLKHQQNPATLPIAVLVLLSKNNRAADLIPLVPSTLSTLDSLAPRTLVEVSY